MDPGNSDTDGDGISDKDELIITAKDPHITNPTNSDTDGDGVTDLNDNCPNNQNPLQEDNDKDGLGDECDSINIDAPEIYSERNAEDTEKIFFINEKITFSVENQIDPNAPVSVDWIFPDGTFDKGDGIFDSISGHNVDVQFEETGKKEIIVNITSHCSESNLLKQQEIIQSISNLPSGICLDYSTTPATKHPEMDIYTCWREDGDWEPTEMPKFQTIPFCTSFEEKIEIEITNGVYALLSNPKDGDKIQINELIQFVDESYSLTEPIIKSIIDFDDEEQAWGAFSISAPITEVPTCFSKIGTNEFCIGNNILTLDNQIYDGVPCGCKNYYMSFPTKKKDITGFVGGTTAHKYESIDACGDDKLCNVNLTIKTENYEASIQINLIFDKQAICEDDPENDICKIQTIDDICDRFPDYFVQCRLDAPVGNLTNDTTNLNALSTNVAAQDNFVVQNTPNKDQYDDPLDNIKEKEKKPSQNYDYGGGDKNEGSSGSGGLMLIVILLITLLGGVGFFLWQRSKYSGSKPENKDLDSTEASTDEPEQSSDL